MSAEDSVPVMAADAVGTVLAGPLSVTLGVVSLVTSAVVAGTAAMGRSVPPSRRSVAVVRSAAIAASVALVAGWLTGAVTVLAALLQAAGVVALAVLFARGFRDASAVGGVLLTGALAYRAASGHTGWQLPLTAVHIVAAVLWLGAVVLVATPACGARSAVVRSLGPITAVAATVVVTTGFLKAVASGLRLDAVTVGSLPGQVLGLEALFVVLALVAAGLRRSDATGGRVAALAVVLVVAAGAVLTVLTPPPAPADSGRPLLRTVALRGEEVPVVVVPQRPGVNLVHVGEPGALVAGVPAVERAGAPGGWAVVDLPAGTDVLTLESGGERVPLRLDLGTDPAPPALVSGLVGPDGPECLSSVLGGMLRDDTELPPACPSDALAPPDAVALRATVGFVADRGVPALYLVADGSRRSDEAAAVVREAAAAHRLPLADRLDPAAAVIVVAGWEGGGRRLAEEALGRPSAGGTYTAPWLATGPVLGRRTGAVTTLDFDPRADPAQLYLADLRAAGATALASPAGFRAWASPSDTAAACTGPRIFAAAPVSVMPAGFGGRDRQATERWLPGWALTPVTPSLPG